MVKVSLVLTRNELIRIRSASNSSRFWEKLKYNYSWVINVIWVQVHYKCSYRTHFNNQNQLCTLLYHKSMFESTYVMFVCIPKAVSDVLEVESWVIGSLHQELKTNLSWPISNVFLFFSYLLHFFGALWPASKKVRDEYIGEDLTLCLSCFVKWSGTLHNGQQVQKGLEISSNWVPKRVR